MRIEKELCEKFPAVLRQKLMSGELVLPEKTEFDYEKFLVYRVIERKKDEFYDVTRDDFKSYFELNKIPKKPRGSREDILKDPHYYGVSSFLQKEIVQQIMKFPRPTKKMAVGYVYKEGGPQETNFRTMHVCWWLYEDADVSGFRIIEG